MKIHTAVAIGNFDGLHRGHQRIIFRLLKLAKEKKLKPLVLSFTPHPASIFSKGLSFLTSETQKKKRLKKWAVGLYLLDFRKIEKFSAEEFVQDILLKKLKVKMVIVGENFRFGYRREGDINLLEELGKKHSFEVKVVPLLKEKGKAVSSGLIRKLLKEGKIEQVNNLLGWEYEVEGKVIHGTGRGKRLGFPTANLAIDNDLLLPEGVFAGLVKKNDQVYPGIVNVGRHPTFGLSNQAQLEVHLFSFQDKLYGEKIRVIFLGKIRAEKKFSSPLALQKQIAKDIFKAKKILNRIGI